MYLPNSVLKIIDILNSNGKEAYVVGGCVRDFCMGNIPHDYDICTNALPDDCLKIFEDFQIIETGLKHGTITVVIDNVGYEVTTFRVDGDYLDSRHPETVSFTSSLKSDLSRRDFTMNAIAYHPSKGFIDPFNGLQDINKRVIKTVGAPKDRFSEDALRIMRALRFSSVLGFEIDVDTSQALQDCVGKLSSVSVERLHSELNKLLVGQNFASVLTEYWGVIATFIPDMVDMYDYNQRNPWHVYPLHKHTIVAMENVENDLTLRLALLFHDIGKPVAASEDWNNPEIFHYKGHPEISSQIVEFIMTDLRYDNVMKNNVVQLVKYHDSQIEPTMKSIRRWLNKIGETQLRFLIKVQIADTLAHNPEKIKERLNVQKSLESIVDEVLAQNQCFSIKDLAINGKDLLRLGFKEGPLLGQILEVALFKVVDGLWKNEKEVLVDNILKLYTYS